MGPKKAKMTLATEDMEMAPAKPAAAKRGAPKKAKPAPAAAAEKSDADEEDIIPAKRAPAKRAPAKAKADKPEKAAKAPPVKKAPAEKKPRAVAAKRGAAVAAAKDAGITSGASDASDEFEESSAEKKRAPPKKAAAAAKKSPAASRAAPKRAAMTATKAKASAPMTKQTRKKAKQDSDDDDKEEKEEDSEDDHEDDNNEENPKKAKMTAPKFPQSNRAAAAKAMNKWTNSATSESGSANEEEFEPPSEEVSPSEDDGKKENGDANGEKINCFVCNEPLKASGLMEHITNEHAKDCPKLDGTGGAHRLKWLYRWVPPAHDNCKSCGLVRERFFGSEIKSVADPDGIEHDQTPPAVMVQFDGQLFALFFEQPEEEYDHSFYSWVSVVGDGELAAKYVAQIRFRGKKLLVQSEWNVFPMGCNVDEMLYGDNGPQVMQGNTGWFQHVDAQESVYRELDFEYIIRKL